MQDAENLVDRRSLVAAEDDAVVVARKSSEDDVTELPRAAGDQQRFHLRVIPSVARDRCGRVARASRFAPPTHTVSSPSLRSGSECQSFLLHFHLLRFRQLLDAAVLTLHRPGAI